MLDAVACNFVGEQLLGTHLTGTFGVKSSSGNDSYMIQAVILLVSGGPRCQYVYIAEPLSRCLLQPALQPSQIILNRQWLHDRRIVTVVLFS